MLFYGLGDSSDGSDLTSGGLLDPSSWGSGGDSSSSGSSSSDGSGGGSLITGSILDPSSWGSSNPTQTSSQGGGTPWWATAAGSVAQGITAGLTKPKPAKPWYATPVGMGGIAVVGIALLYMLFKK